MSENTTQSFSQHQRRSIINAAIQGIGLWILLYGISVHLVVIWKWQSGDPYEVSLPNDSIALTTGGSEQYNQVVVDDDDREEEELVEIEEIEVINTVYLDTISRHEEKVLQRVTELQEALNKIESSRNEMKDYITQSKELTQQAAKGVRVPHDRSWPTGEMGPRTRNLVSLLETEGLDSFGDFRLKTTFQQVKGDLRSIISNNSTMQWKDVITALSGNYPSRKRSTSSASCPSQIEHVSEQSIEEMIPPDAVRLPMLYEYKNGVEKLFNKRQPGVEITAAVLPESLARLEKKCISNIHKVFGIISEEAAKENEEVYDDTVCVKEEQVIQMVEEGISALYSKADIRSVLRKEVMKLDPTATSIILDAVLPVSQPDVPKKSDTINLRRLLDTELTVKASDWIDQLVEICEGYNEVVDQFIDNIVATASDGEQQRLGEIIIAQLLHHAGRVNIPHPRSIVEKLPKEVQDLLPKLESLN